MGYSTPSIVIKAKRPPAAFICGKCLKRCDAGRSIRKALKSELDERTRVNGRRRTKLVETKCMGLCPKQAVVVAGGAALVTGELILLKQAGDVAAALDLLIGTAAV